MVWSDNFQAEEHAARRRTGLDVVLAWVACLATAGALLTEIGYSVLVTSEQLTSRGGSAGTGLIAIGLGFVGPYAGLLSWRAATTAGKPPRARLMGTALVAFGVAVLAVAWLIFLHSLHHIVRFIP